MDSYRALGKAWRLATEKRTEDDRYSITQWVGMVVTQEVKRLHLAL